MFEYTTNINYNEKGDNMKNKIQDMDVKGKKVLLRCDFNVPVKDGKILDDSKIIASLRTINHLIKEGAKIIILSHFGKVKTAEDKNKNTLAPIAERLQELVDTKVIFSKQTRSLYIETKIENMKPGEIMLLENTRHEDVPDKLESGNDVQLAMYWAGIADVFCLDAFGSSHRKHASTYGVAKYLPSCVGFLVQQEVEALDKYVLNAEKPFTILMGGAKVEDKVELIEVLLPKCDHLLLTGGIANSCLHILGFDVGSSLRTKDEAIMSKIKTLLIQNKDKILLPLDAIVGRDYRPDYVNHVNIDKVEDDDCIYDIGVKTIDKYKEIIDKTATIFINGTAGKYEESKYATGTRELLSYIAESKAVKIVGGGDGVSAVKHFKLGEKYDHLSTGGGATLEYIVNEGLPCIDNIIK